MLSWYDEHPDWLAEMVQSVAPLVDGVIAVDGPYPLTPHQGETSSTAEYEALRKACDLDGLELHTYSPGALSEVDKRAFMFQAALTVAEPMQDWFLIMDGDMWMGEAWPERVRYHLARTDRHAAEVTFHNLDRTPDAHPKVRPFRSMFRAIPGLTVEGTHAVYTVPDFKGERLLLWMPVGDQQAVPTLNLTEHVHLYHRPHRRDEAREALRAAYYDRRSIANIEQVPDYTQE